MRHDDDRERLLEFKDAFLKALRCNRIQSTAGLIHQKHFGFNRQRTCNAEALLLAAGKPQGTVVKTVFDFFKKRGALQTFLHLVADEGFVGDAGNSQTISDVFKNGFGKGRGPLKDHADTLSERHHVKVRRVDVIAVQRDFPRDVGVGDEFVHARKRS